MDLIDRQDTIDIVAFECGEWQGLAKEINEQIQRLPPVESTQKTGKWIDCDSSEHWKCSECGCRASYWFNEENSSSYELDMSEWLSDYCPNCGARMECEEE